MTKESQGAYITSISNQIRKSILNISDSRETESKIAFNIADIIGDFPEIFSFIEECKKDTEISSERLLDIISLICDHWDYHQKELRRLRRKIRKKPNIVTD